MAYQKLPKFLEYVVDQLKLEPASHLLEFFIFFPEHIQKNVGVHILGKNVVIDCNTTFV